MLRPGRTSEYEIGQAVLRFLIQTPEGAATISDIKKHLDRNHRFTPADRERSGTRPNEERWHQQVRNLMCHRRTSGNAISDGLLEYSPRRLAITRLGRDYVERRYGADGEIDLDVG